MEEISRTRKQRIKRHKEYKKLKKQKARLEYINSMPFVKFVASLDNKLFFKIFKTERTKPIKNVMKFISKLGDGYIWLILALFFLISNVSNLALLLTRALSTSFYCIITFIYIKKLIQRVRPYKKYKIIPLMLPPDIHSFPSGHTMVSFGLAISMGTYNYPIAIVFYLFAFLIGYSRIFVGLHYPVDVGSSIIIGTIIGFANNLFFNFLTGMPIIGH